MDCILCGSKGSELKSVALLSDQVNKFGRREITYVAEHQDNIHWEKDSRYHCDICGGSFSYKEYTLQKKEAVDPQVKLC